jgi:uncharacterized protein
MPYASVPLCLFLHMRKFLTWAILIYALLGIGMYYAQGYLFFRAVPVRKDHRYSFSIPYREVNLPFRADANLNIIQFETQKAIRGVVLYLHGNRKNIGWYAQFAPTFTDQGYEVWMLDYPGYGKSTGELTEASLYEYAEQLYKLAGSKYPADSIIIYGKSMGTGLATYLASRERCKRVILETPYYSLSSVAAYYLPVYPMEQMIKVKIPSWQYLAEVKDTVIILHGTADGVIPYSNASRLKPYLKNGDEFITIDGGSHNDLREFNLFNKKLDSLLK